jgi:hypothetical protein
MIVLPGECGAVEGNTELQELVQTDLHGATDGRDQLLSDDDASELVLVFDSVGWRHVVVRRHRLLRAQSQNHLMLRHSRMPMPRKAPDGRSTSTDS